MKKFPKIALIALVGGLLTTYSHAGGDNPFGGVGEEETMRQQFVILHGPDEGMRRFEEWRREQDVARDAAPIRERWLRYEREKMADRETAERRLLEGQEAGVYEFLQENLHEAVQQAATALNARADDLEREADMAHQSADWKALTRAKPLRERAERLRVEAVRLLELFPAPALLEAPSFDVDYPSQEEGFDEEGEDPDMPPGYEGGPA